MQLEYDYKEQLNFLNLNFNPDDIDNYYLATLLFYNALTDPDFISYKVTFLNILNNILDYFGEIVNITANTPNIKDKKYFITLFYMIKSELMSSMSISIELKTLLEKTLNDINEITSNTKSSSNNSIDETVNMFIQTLPSTPEVTYRNPNSLKEYLIHNNQLQEYCAICHTMEWQNMYLPLILDFIDGNSNNQELNNIRLLCPNCYAQVGHGHYRINY